MKIRRRVRVQHERSKFRFKKNHCYFSEVTGDKYWYDGKTFSTFYFVTKKGLTSIQEYELSELNLTEI